MDWRGRKESSNVEDRRGRGSAGKGIAGLGGIGIVIYLVMMLLGVDPGPIMNGDLTQVINGTPATSSSTSADGTYQESAAEKESRQFVSVVFRDTEDIWTAIFRQNGLTYKKPTLVLYTGSTQTACGGGESAMGPFYCPADEKVYLDLGFYQDLKNKYQAPGDFAMAYVIAHEVGHHVQNQLGISEQVQAMRSRLSEAEYNRLSVRNELQADYFAGVWARQVQGKGYLDEGDIEEAINAAQAVGDDTLQKKAYGRTVPDSFTHGSAAQRARWFKKGFTNGTIQGGDTFNAVNL